MPKLTDFTPDLSNANKGTERGLRSLDDSIAALGLGRSIVVDKHGVIIAGNKTHERAIDRGIEDAEVVHTTGDKLVVVQRDDLDLSSPDPNNPARKLAYADNRVGELDLQWDAEQLLADVSAGMDLSALFGDYELADLLALHAGVSSLDELSEKYGEVEDEAFWPIITVKVAPDVFAAYQASIAAYPGDTEAEQFSAWVMDVVSRHELP